MCPQAIEHVAHRSALNLSQHHPHDELPLPIEFDLPHALHLHGQPSPLDELLGHSLACSARQHVVLEDPEDLLDISLLSRYLQLTAACCIFCP
jgi:hypothetical protein